MWVYKTDILCNFGIDKLGRRAPAGKSFVCENFLICRRGGPWSSRQASACREISHLGKTDVLCRYYGRRQAYSASLHFKFASQTLTIPYQIGAIISQINQDFQKATVFYFLHIELVEEFGESGDIVRAVGFNYIMAAGNDL